MSVDSPQITYDELEMMVQEATRGARHLMVVAYPIGHHPTCDLRSTVMEARGGPQTFVDGKKFGVIELLVADMVDDPGVTLGSFGFAIEGMWRGFPKARSFLMKGMARYGEIQPDAKPRRRYDA